MGAAFSYEGMDEHRRLRQLKPLTKQAYERMSTWEKVIDEGGDGSAWDEFMKWSHYYTLLLCEASDLAYRLEKMREHPRPEKLPPSPPPTVPPWLQEAGASSPSPAPEAAELNQAEAAPSSSSSSKRLSEGGSIDNSCIEEMMFLAGSPTHRDDDSMPLLPGPSAPGVRKRLHHGWGMQQQ